MRYLIVLRAQFDDVVSRALGIIKQKYDFITYYKLLRELDDITQAPALAFATNTDITKIPASRMEKVLQDAVAFPISQKDSFVEFEEPVYGEKSNPDYFLDTIL